MTEKNLKTYRKILVDNKYDFYYDVVNELKTFINKLCYELMVNGVKPVFELGINVRVGQQFNMGLNIISHDKKEVFIVAYVPDSGYPLILDFNGKSMTIENKNDLERKLYDEVPITVMDRLRAIYAVK